MKLRQKRKCCGDIIETDPFALSKTVIGQNASKGPLNRGFTLVELLVVIAIISLLVSILLPSLVSAKQLAQRVACLSCMRGIASANLFYIEDNDGSFPNGRSNNWLGYWDGSKTVVTVWFYLLNEYAEDKAIFKCPAAERHSYFDGGIPTVFGEWEISIGYNIFYVYDYGFTPWVKNIRDVQCADKAMLTADTGAYGGVINNSDAAGTYNIIDGARHIVNDGDVGFSQSFVDGHCEASIQSAPIRSGDPEARAYWWGLN